MHKLEGRRVIAINSSWTVAPFADFLFFADQRWWNQYGAELRSYTGIAVTTASGCTDPRVRLVRKDKPPAIAFDDNSVSLSRTSLSGGLVLAAKLGARRAVLVGADGRLGDNGRRHNHEVQYPWPFKADSFSKQKEELTGLVPGLRRWGIEVLNASPDSYFDMFPGVSLDDCLNEEKHPVTRQQPAARRYTITRSGEALERFVAEKPYHTLDIGSGGGEYAQIMREAGLTVTTLDLGHQADIVANYMDTKFTTPFTALWASHVLEHQTDVGAFLRKMRQDVAVGGLVSITVPPAKEAIVGGHLTLWNAGLLVYNMILAGFDCSTARIGTYGYNISILVRRIDAALPPLHYDKGDIELLAPFFPLPVQHGFNGRLPNVRW